MPSITDRPDLDLSNLYARWFYATTLAGWKRGKAHGWRFIGVR